MSLAYDHLVFALGSPTSTFGIAGRRRTRVRAQNARRCRTRCAIDLVWLLELADTIDDAERRRAADARGRRRRIYRRGNGGRNLRTLSQRGALLPALRRDDVRNRSGRRRKDAAARACRRDGRVFARAFLERRGVEVITATASSPPTMSGSATRERTAHRERDHRLERRRTARVRRRSPDRCCRDRRGTIAVRSGYARERISERVGARATAPRFPTARAAFIRRRRSTRFAKAPHLADNIVRDAARRSRRSRSATSRWE